MEAVEGLDELWASRWPDSRPLGHELRRTESRRWVRFHSLPGSKRYAESDAERAIVLSRHNDLLVELLALEHCETTREVLVLTCGWGDRTDTARLPDLIDVDPDATLWRSELWDESGSDFVVWAHLWASRRTWSPGVLDRLLAMVADDRTGSVLIAPPSLAWLYHPYDGGADVIAPSQTTRDRLAEAHQDWLPGHPDGL